MLPGDGAAHEKTKLNSNEQSREKPNQKSFPYADIAGNAGRGLISRGIISIILMFNEYSGLKSLVTGGYQYFVGPGHILHWRIVIGKCTECFQRFCSP
jgi:hypothetical protein